MTRQTESERLRECREIFARAQRDNVTMEEARKRIALDKVAENRRAIAALKDRANALNSRVPAQARVSGSWWLEGQYA